MAEYIELTPDRRFFDTQRFMSTSRRVDSREFPKRSGLEGYQSFHFFTMDQPFSRPYNHSPVYFLGGEILSLEELEERAKRENLPAAELREIQGCLINNKALGTLRLEQWIATTFFRTPRGLYFPAPENFVILTETDLPN